MFAVSADTSPRHRALPAARVHTSSVHGESHDGTCTPLVTWSTGTSSSGQRGNKSANRRRLTAPCSWLTPLTHQDPRMASHAMLNGSLSSSGSRRPSASSSSQDTPRPSDVVIEVGATRPDLVGWKTIEAGRHGRVGREHVAGARRSQRLAKRHAVLLHEAARALDHDEGRVSLVEVTHVDPEAERIEEPPPADAEDDLLQQADLGTAAVQRARQAAIAGALKGSLLSSR